MDPDAIFIILLYIILLVVTVVNLIGLSNKIWSTGLSIVLKILLTGILLLLLVLGLFNIDTVDTGNVFISTAEFIVICASFVIAINWSINISRNLSKRPKKINPFIVIPLLTIFFTLLIPFCLYWLGNLFDKLNLMGSGG